MESSTEDVCEWCKRPMLPAGASITGRTREGGAAAEPSGGEPESPGEDAEGAAPLAGEPTTEEEQPEEEAGRPEVGEGAKEQVLRPLGSTQATRGGGTAAPSMPSHGVSQEATQTSVDLSQYTGKEESIFRPIERPQRADTLGGADPLAARRRREEAEAKSDIPENVRLVRSVIAGAIISVILALLQLIVSRTLEGASSVPNQLVFASVALIRDLGDRDSVLTVLIYGVLVGLMMGLGLGAVLVRFKRGPFIGMIVGLLVGYGLLNGVWGYVCGGLTGIASGIIATVGLRQVARV